MMPLTPSPDPKWRLALLDLDGTLFRGTDPIEGSGEFVQRLRRHHVQPVFFTNNSSRTPAQVAEKLSRMGIAANANEVCTSAQMSTHLLGQRLGNRGTIGYIGGEGLAEALTDGGFEAVYVPAAPSDVLSGCQGVVLGMDQSVTYQGLAAFCRAADRLGWFVLTNTDVRLPHQNGFDPGNGALGQFVATATGLKPVVAGKPEPAFVSYAVERYGVELADAVIIGDNLKTDILAGQRAGIASILVDTGVVYNDPATLDIQPDWHVSSVADLFPETPAPRP